MMHKTCSMGPGLRGRERDKRRPVTWGVRFGGRGEKCSLSLNRSRRTVPIPVPGRALNSNSGVDENSPRPPDPAQTKEEKPTPAPSQDPRLVLDIWVYSHVTDEEMGSGICHVLDSATFTRLATHHNGGCSGNKQQQRGN